MEGMKTNIDNINYFSFFQGYDDGKKEEPKDNKPVIQGDKDEAKDAKKKDGKKSGKKGEKKKDKANVQD